jgi:serine/threonine protein kinase
MTDLRAQLQEGLATAYTLEHELGRGGMATVFLARDLKHDRPVAFKVLHPELASSLRPERFLREIKLAARLQHPHILTVLDSGETAGRLWFTMPLVEGESLRDLGSTSWRDSGRRRWSGSSWSSRGRGRSRGPGTRSIPLAPIRSHPAFVRLVSGSP